MSIPRPPEMTQGSPTVNVGEGGAPTVYLGGTAAAASGAVGRKRRLTCGTCFSAVVLCLGLVCVLPVVFGVGRDMVSGVFIRPSMFLHSAEDESRPIAGMTKFYSSLIEGEYDGAYALLDKSAFADYDADRLEQEWNGFKERVGAVKLRGYKLFIIAVDGTRASGSVVLEAVDGGKRFQLEVLLMEQGDDWKITQVTPNVIPVP